MSNRKEDPPLHCNQCGMKMARLRLSSGRLEDLGRFMKRKYCSRRCHGKVTSTKPTKKQTAHWESLKKDVVGISEYRKRARAFRRTSCEQCGSVKNLQVHHKDMVPANNSPKNLKTLCAGCHNSWHRQERMAHGK